MTRFNTILATTTAFLLLAGNAAAAPLQPAAGEGPFFDQPVQAASTLQRAEVRADAARQLPAAGELSAQATPLQASSATRAEVRAATRDAMAHGFRVASGENA